MKRAAIYCRQSVADDLEFGSIEAQRESIEAYVKSQPGWKALEHRYDDEGFSGANTNRPAFQQLVRDVANGGVDIVAVYKIDRLSRSIGDFAQTMRLFDSHDVAFVSTTQQFDTSGSMGKLMLNVLMSFAEFEREVISERTRDKMAATRKRGAWTGGIPMLGYDVVEKRLVVNDVEAEQVRGIFELFIELGAIGRVVTEINDRGWRTKQHKKRGGKLFENASVRKILTSRLYFGQVEFEGEVFDGDHEAIIDPDTFENAQALIKRQPKRQPARRWSSLLAGLLRCEACGGGYVHTFTNKGKRRHRYYVCVSIQKRGATACPGSRLPASELEDEVIGQIRAIGRDPTIVRATLDAARSATERDIPILRSAIKGLQKDQERLAAEKSRLVDAIASGIDDDSLVERLQQNECERKKVRKQAASKSAEIEALRSRSIDEADVGRALAQFDPIWQALTNREKARLLKLLVDEVTYDAPSQRLSIKLRPEGVRYLTAPEGKSA